MPDYNKCFIDKTVFQNLYRDMTVDELKSFDIKAQIVSDAIRQEAKNVNEDIDILLESGKLYLSVLQQVTVSILARWFSQPTDFPTIDSSTDGFDSSTTWYNNSNMGVIILKRELKLLGILRQQMITFENEVSIYE